MNKKNPGVKFDPDTKFDPDKSMAILGMALRSTPNEELDHLFDHALDLYKALHEKGLDLRQSLCVVAILLNFMQITWTKFMTEKVMKHEKVQ